MTRAECVEALKHPNVQAFLAVLRFTEHGKQWVDDKRVYRREFGGKLFPAAALDDDKPRSIIDRGIRSSAKGAYQFLNGTWDECKAALSLDCFSPVNQDLAAVFLIGRRRALYILMDGDLEGAVKRCAKEWASLPGSPYGQPVKTMAEVRAVFTEYGGKERAHEKALVQI